MKNIHILPTLQKSEYFINKEGILSESYSLKRGGAVHFYITSDVEIKEGDYFYQSFDSIVHRCYKLTDNYVIAEKPSDYPKKICKKIILTTDQDLIADGVQAIDDTFLEWFCKNSSCEEVETSFACLEERQCMCKSNESCLKSGYQIIIPKEEAKQECTCGVCDNCEKQESIQILKEAKENALKQETLEEVAERLVKETTLYGSQEASLGSSARSYFETELRCVLLGMQWQQQNGYSEEEVIKLLHKRDEHMNTYEKLHGGFQTPKEWLAKFKKK